MSGSSVLPALHSSVATSSCIEHMHGTAGQRGLEGQLRRPCHPGTHSRACGCDGVHTSRQCCLLCHNIVHNICKGSVGVQRTHAAAHPA